MGYFYDKVVAECPEHSAYEERFACPGSEKQNIAATFAGGGDNI